jgi:hypothetical protein
MGQVMPEMSLFCFSFFLEALEFEFRAKSLLSRHSYHLSHPPAVFSMVGFFEIGSLELFTQAGFKL